jgi:trehalose-6-phosphate synthase
VNPYDVTGVAEALQTALWMPLPQRRERYEAMFNSIRGNDIHAWNRRFLAALQAPNTPLPTAPSTAIVRVAGPKPGRARNTLPAAMQYPER